MTFFAGRGVQRRVVRSVRLDKVLGCEAALKLSTKLQVHFVVYFLTLDNDVNISIHVHCLFDIFFYYFKWLQLSIPDNKHPITNILPVNMSELHGSDGTILKILVVFWLHSKPIMWYPSIVHTEQYFPIPPWGREIYAPTT